MADYDIQLRTILHSYRVEGSSLVYNNNDGYFYTVGSTSQLNKQEFETRSRDVATRVDEFIRTHYVCLNPQLLSEFKEHLDSRICRIKARTSGLLMLLYYVFNPQNKASLQDQKLLMENLRGTIDDALAELQEIDEEEKNEVVDAEVEEDIHEESVSDESLFVPSTPNIEIKTHSPLPPGTHGKKTTIPQRLFDDLPAQLRSPLHSSPKGGTPKPRTPLHSHLSTPGKPFMTPTNTPFFIPPPPPPPPMIGKPPAPPKPPAFNLTPHQKLNIGTPLRADSPSDMLPNIKLIATEPNPPAFSATKYKTLPQGELSQQIDAIEEYVQKTLQALEPIDQLIKDYLSLQELIKQHQADLSKTRAYLKQCEENLKSLKEGEENGTGAILFFKSSKGYNQIPFYTDDLQKEILRRTQELEAKAQKEKQALEDEIERYKQKWEECETEVTKTGIAQNQIAQIRKQQEEIECKLEALQPKLADCSQIVSVDKSRFYPYLKISQAIHDFEELIEGLRERTPVLEAEGKTYEKRRQQLEATCQKDYGVDLAALQLKLQAKIKQLDTWTRHKNSRRTLLNQKAGRVKTPPPKTNTSQGNKLPTFKDEFPLLELLYNLPKEFSLMASRSGLSGGDIEEILDDFHNRIHGKLFSTDG